MNENKQYFASKDEYYSSKIRTLKAENEELKAQLLERSDNSEYAQCNHEYAIRQAMICNICGHVIEMYGK